MIRRGRLLFAVAMMIAPFLLLLLLPVRFSPPRALLLSPSRLYLSVSLAPVRVRSVLLYPGLMICLGCGERESRSRATTEEGQKTSERASVRVWIPCCRLVGALPSSRGGWMDESWESQSGLRGGLGKPLPVLSVLNITEK